MLPNCNIVVTHTHTHTEQISVRSLSDPVNHVAIALSKSVSYYFKEYFAKSLKNASYCS